MKEKLNIFLSTLNFVLFFVGYQLITSIFLPDSSDVEGISRTVTIPYRAFALLISFSVIIINFKRKLNPLPVSVVVFLFYWTILILRMIYDVYFRTNVQLEDTSQLWLYVFGICIPAVISVIKSYDKINLDKSFYWVLGLIAITLVITLFTNQALLVSAGDLEGRQSANLALNTISFGHFGVSGIILGLYALFNIKLKSYQKSLLFLLIFLGIFSMLRAGSRGPIVALVTVLFFWIFSRGKNLLLSIFNLIFVGIILLFFFEYILELMGQISPVIEERLKMSIYEGDTSERNPLFMAAIRAFFDSPFIGSQFAILFPDGTFAYPHNIILESFMGMGIFGGFSLIYVLLKALKNSYFWIRSMNAQYWICLLLVQQISADMLSGAFYYDQLLSGLLVFQFLSYSRRTTITMSI